MQWYCKYGDLPYSQEWPQISESKDTGKYAALKATCESQKWRCSTGGLPYKTQWPPILKCCGVVRQNEYITVYDMCADQKSFFESNGICILQPTKCEITEELNGMYELILTHPIDAWGKWRYLLELNTIKAGGQLFRIYKKQTNLNSDGTRSRTVYCRHIFYDLNDKALADVRPTKKAGRDFIDWILTHTIEDYTDQEIEKGYMFYNFSYDSDITEEATAIYQSMSPVNALLGADNCFLNRLGGEIYRDNFYFSINSKREKSRENAFNVCRGVDMLEVEEVVDYSNFITCLKAESNYGSGMGIAYGQNSRIHHNVTRFEKYTYGEDYSDDTFFKDVRNRFESMYQPGVSYKVRFADLKNDARYSGFIDLQHCEVGDSGTVYCEELDIVTTQRVVQKVYDVLHDKVISIELGNKSPGLTRVDRYAGTITGNTAADKANEKTQADLHNTKLKLLSTWAGARSFTWKEAREFKWKEVTRS